MNLLNLLIFYDRSIFKTMDPNKSCNCVAYVLSLVVVMMLIRATWSIETLWSNCVDMFQVQFAPFFSIGKKGNWVASSDMAADNNIGI